MAKDTESGEHAEAGAEKAHPEGERKGQPESQAREERGRAPAEGGEKKPKPEGGEKKTKGEGGEKKAKPGGGEKKAKAEAGGGKRSKGDRGDGKKGDRAPKKPAQPARPAPPPRLFLRYKSEIVPSLMKEFGYANPMQVPRLEKITVNMGLGEAVSNSGIINAAAEELTQIAGQRAVVTRAKKSISNFKLRAGQPIGCMVTLRRARMWEFLDRLMSIAIPRVRDFKGVSGRAFDGRGNYSLGIREQIIFPEINYDQVEKVKGMNVTITTTARNDKEGKALLKYLGMPFRN
jgi:large subunit ribosomal protein L5